MAEHQVLGELLHQFKVLRVVSVDRGRRVDYDDQVEVSGALDLLRAALDGCRVATPALGVFAVRTRAHLVLAFTAAVSTLIQISQA